MKKLTCKIFGILLKEGLQMIKIPTFHKPSLLDREKKCPRSLHNLDLDVDSYLTFIVLKTIRFFSLPLFKG